jgi:hypothetical protein
MPQSNADPSTNWAMAYSIENSIETDVCEYGTKNVKVSIKIIATPATLNQRLTNQKKKQQQQTNTYNMSYGGVVRYDRSTSWSFTRCHFAPRFPTWYFCSRHETDRFRVENVFVFVTSPRFEREGTWELRKRICLLQI